MEDVRILCCQCAIAIPPNAVNMCVNCLQERYNIAEGVSKQVQQNTCRGCGRFERRDGSYAEVDMESKELLALLLKKPRGLTSVRLVDASYIWTEPHSRRIKLKLTVQKEVVEGAVLQQVPNRTPVGWNRRTDVKRHTHHLPPRMSAILGWGGSALPDHTHGLELATQPDPTLDMLWARDGGPRTHPSTTRALYSMVRYWQFTPRPYPPTGSRVRPSRTLPGPPPVPSPS